MSPSSMQANSKPGKPVAIDPVCGMKVDAESPPCAWNYQGKQYHFCSTTCKELFQWHPEKYLTMEIV